MVRRLDFGVCRRSASLVLFFFFFVARVSAAKPGDDSEDCNAAPGYRFAHPGYLIAPCAERDRAETGPTAGLKTSA